MQNGKTFDTKGTQKYNAKRTMPLAPQTAETATLLALLALLLIYHKY